jgi:hypothetical protein
MRKIIVRRRHEPSRIHARRHPQGVANLQGVSHVRHTKIFQHNCRAAACPQYCVEHPPVDAVALYKI